jgi:hypothetical protein
MAPMKFDPSGTGKLKMPGLRQGGVLGPNVTAFTAGATSGALIAAITGLTGDELLSSIAPNDGRVALSMDRRSLIVGLSASAAGTISYTLATSAGRTLKIDVTASASSAQTIQAQINAYSSSAGASPANLAAWNDLNSYVHYGSTTLPLKDSGGASTGWTASWTTQVDTGGANTGPTGVSGIPDAVAASNTFIDNANATPASVRTTATLRFSGLDPTKTYTIETFSARGASGAARLTNMASNGVTSSVDALVNRAFQPLTPLTPSAQGVLDVVMTQGASTQFAYMNAVRITQLAFSNGQGSGPTTFNALSLSPGQATAGNYYSGTVTGATAGTTISIGGLTVTGTGTTRTVTGAAPSSVGNVDAVESASGKTPRTTTGLLSVLDATALTVATDTAPVAGVPIIGTYGRNDRGSVAQFYNWLGKVPFGGYGEPHLDRGYGKTNFTDASAAWVGSPGVAIPASGWAGAGREIVCALPMIPFFGSMADAAGGAYDSRVTQIFASIFNLLDPTQSIIRIRLGWEFNSPPMDANGNFQPWGTGNDATTQGYYVQIFQRYVNIARGISAKFKFDWVMNPGSFPFAPCYPGDTYVDRIGMDMYPGLNDKNVYRAPNVVTPQAQAAMFNYFMGQQYGPYEAKAFADARGKPFIIPEFAIEWDNGQTFMDLFWNWMVSGSNPVAAIGIWNESSATLPQDNVRFGISGVYGQPPEVPNTSACIRYRWNQAAYPSQPSTPAGTMVNRLATDLTTWGKAGNTTVALVSGETDPDGLATYKLTSLDTTTNSIKRITNTGKCPRGVQCVARILVYADTVGFAIFNGPAGSQTGKYEINLATGAITCFTDNASGNLAALQAKVSTPVKRGNFWEFTITDTTTGTALAPLIHMQPAAGDETAYVGSSTTSGIKISRCEILTY